MIYKKFLLVLLGMIAVLSILNSGLAAPGERVNLLRVPDGGLQPQSVLDSSGALHLIYFLGEPGSGDIYYVRRAPGRSGFSPPIRVNSEAGSAIATVTIRGAQLAVGKGGRIHVAWNGSHKPGENEMQMLYSRMKDDRSSLPSAASPP